MPGMEEKRLAELARRAGRTGQTQFSRFLEPSMDGAARAAAAGAHVQVAFYGGHPDAERHMAAFFDGVEPLPEDYPISILRLTWNVKYANPGHRDLLGAVMGLGIERDATGDIVMGEYRSVDCAYLFAVPEVADYIAANLTAAGRAALKVETAEEAPILKPPAGDHLRITLQSERLDAVLAAGCRMSRAEAQRMISAGLVKLNHVPQLKSDLRVAAGDLISVRGHGRLRVEALLGETRRGRLAMLLFKYGK